MAELCPSPVALEPGARHKATNPCAAGVDDVDSYEELCHFIRTVSERSGVRHFVMHARKCLLSGLSPAQNRTVPPLRCVLRVSWTVLRHVQC